jgi:hypothetical protein
MAAAVLRRRRAAAALFAALLLGSAAAHAAHGLSVDQESGYSRRGSGLVRKSSSSWLTAPWRLVHLGMEPILWEPARWLIENAGEGTTVALPDIGFVGWATDLAVYDTHGLVNREVARLYYLRRSRQATLNGDLVDDFTRVSPDYVLIRRARESGEGINPQEKALLSSGRFGAGWAEERTFRFNDLVDLVLFVRRPAPPTPSPETVVSRYRSAIRWSPRVPHLQIGLCLFHRSRGETAAAEEVASRGRERFPYASSFR